MPNQNPEQIARDKIDNLLELAGWKIQSKSKIDFSAGIGVAVREYQTDAGPADYVLFVNRKPVGIIEAKREEEGANLTVMSMETKPYHRRPVPPFTTSTLQQSAGNSLGMSSRATMRAAQSLYENGYITYMRTDSVTLSREAIAAAREAVEATFGSRFLSDKPKQYATKTAGAQEAHEAIRPAGATFRSPESLQGALPPSPEARP